MSFIVVSSRIAERNAAYRLWRPHLTETTALHLRHRTRVLRWRTLTAGSARAWEGLNEVASPEVLNPRQIEGRHSASPFSNTRTCGRGVVNCPLASVLVFKDEAPVRDQAPALARCRRHLAISQGVRLFASELLARKSYGVSTFTLSYPAGTFKRRPGPPLLGVTLRLS